MRKLVSVVAAALLWPAAAAAYPWPLKPFHEPHAVRSNLGDPRTVFFDQPPEAVDGPGLFSFHNGIDISAPAGTPVYPVADGTVHFQSPTVIAVRAPGVEFKYVHILPVVYEGEFVHRSRTVLGYVAAWARHLHFTEIRHHHVVNPLRRGGITPYFDHTNPVVSELVIRTQDQREVEKPYTVCGTITIAAAADDPQSMPSPLPWTGLPVTPAIVSWSMRAVAGPVVVPPRVVADFLRGLPPNRRFWDVYERGTFQNSAHFGHIQLVRLEGYYLFYLARSFDTRTLPNGAYVLTVTAQDARGNQGMLSETVTVANGPAGCTA